MQVNVLVNNCKQDVTSLSLLVGTTISFVKYKHYVLGSHDITINLSCSIYDVPYPRMGPKSQKQHITP